MNNREISRVREKGTIVTSPKTGLERIQALRGIVKRCQYAKIDGQMIDLFSANAIVQIYDALSLENQVKYRNMTAPKMAHIAFKLMK